MHKVLIVEDDRTISKVLSAYLAAAGYVWELVDDGARALDVFRTFNPSIVLLDVVLPGKDGWTILKEIRAEGACPVIMLTALDKPDQRIDGLNSGADDYIGKPFQGKEVVARIQAVLRRMPIIVSEDYVTYGKLRVDFGARAIYYNGDLVRLSPRDLALILFLAQNPNQAFSRDTLIHRVWGMDYSGSDRAVDLSVKRIRQSLPELNDETGQIVSLRGFGYQFRVSQKG